jgi:hypothetical protein
VRDDLASGKAKGARFFFLSYANSQRYGAQSPAVDPWLDQFFADLSHEVRTQAGAPPDAEVGFMDREPLSGDDWPVRLDRALAACRVFVPMYSRQYFESEHCGREWSAFIQRSPGGNPAAIVPAVWVPVAPEFIPDVARSIPRDDAGVQAYTDHGFYGIIKLSRYRDSYAAALTHLAGKIVAAAERSPVAAGPVLDYPSLESAFGAAGKGMPGGHPLHITIAAPSLSATGPSSTTSWSAARRCSAASGRPHQNCSSSIRGRPCRTSPASCCGGSTPQTRRGFRWPCRGTRRTRRPRW